MMNAVLTPMTTIKISEEQNLAEIESFLTLHIYCCI